MTMLLPILAVLLLIPLVAVLGFGHWYLFRYRFVEVARGRFFRCQEMPPARLLKTVRRHGVRLVIDLRFPASSGEKIRAERATLERVGVDYVNLPTDQIPPADVVRRFLKTVEDAGPEPILVHCKDGRGRCVLFGAIYLIEFEQLDPDQARSRCRLLASRGTFAPDGAKGRYLLAYSPRRRPSARLFDSAA
jgi:protein tyrosine phosphatase (PTP) superfamily phosphohydrolase (DUF442 family)